MENQHRKITGYGELDQEQIDLINEIKEHGKRVGLLVDRLHTFPDLDSRWIAIGATDLQKGFMALSRAVAKPEFF